MVNARVKYGLKLGLVAIVGFLVVLPWTLAYTYLNEHLVLPYAQRHLICCATAPSDPEGTFFATYRLFAAALAAIVALSSSLALGALVRPKWLLPWAVFCAATAFSVRDASQSKFLGPIGTLFLLPTPTVYVYAVASGIGFWIARSLRNPYGFRLTIGWSGRER